MASLGVEGFGGVREIDGHIVLSGGLQQPLEGVEVLLRGFGPAHESTAQGIHHARLLGDLHGHVTIQDLLHIGETAVELDEGVELGCSTLPDSRADRHTDLQKVGCVVPGAGGGPGNGVLVEVVEEVGAEVQKRDDLLPDSIGQGIGFPAIQVALDREVKETVGKGGGHLRDGSTVLGTVTRTHDVPVVRDNIVTNSPVEDELHSHVLDRRGGQVDLIQEQDALTAAGEEGGGGESGYIPLVHVRKAANVGGGELAEAKVNDLHFVLGGRLVDDGGFADAGGSPHHHGTADPVLDEGIDVGVGFGDVDGQHRVVCC